VMVNRDNTHIDKGIISPFIFFTFLQIGYYTFRPRSK
jgi:hypothetical protein